MADAEAAALRAAIDLLHVPSRLRLFRLQPLPPGMPMVLMIAAGEADAIAHGAALTGRTPDVVRKAAMFFVEQVLLAAEGDSYRILGATPSADGTELRRNMAYLLKAFHPDLGENRDRAVFAGRVTRAWEDLKTQDRRDQFNDAQRAAALAAPVRNGLAKASSGSSKARQQARVQKMAKLVMRQEEAETGIGRQFLRRAFRFFLGANKT